MSIIRSIIILLLIIVWIVKLILKFTKSSSETKKSMKKEVFLSADEYVAMNKEEKEPKRKFEIKVERNYGGNELIKHVESVEIKEVVTHVKKVERNSNGDVPTYEEFVSFVEEIKKESEREYIKVDLEYDENLSIFDSKIGGLPYMSKYDVPVIDSSGDPMYLLAQINCEQLPENDYFPRDGILQFFITADDLYGLEERDKANLGIGHKVIYRERIDKSVSDEDVKGKYVLDKEKYDDMPIDKNHCLKMNFSIAKQSGNPSDVLFIKDFIDKYNEKFYQNITDVYDFPDSFMEYLNDELYELDTQVLGYAGFTQDDIREDDYDDYDILLLQIGEDEDYIRWGDSGVANFFIREGDLKSKIFSRVLYNWDCC